MRAVFTAGPMNAAARCAWSVVRPAIASGGRAGLRHQATQRLRDAAGADNRGPMVRRHFTAANVRVNHPASAAETSLLTLRSWRAPYSATSPLTAGTRQVIDAFDDEQFHRFGVAFLLRDRGKVLGVRDRHFVIKCRVHRSGAVDRRLSAPSPAKRSARSEPRRVGSTPDVRWKVAESFSRLDCSDDLFRRLTLSARSCGAS